MSEQLCKVRFHHPLCDKDMELELPASTTFGDILKLLYSNGFIEKKPADYGFIVEGRLGALNKSLSSYVELPAKDVVDVKINGSLTIMC